MSTIRHFFGSEQANVVGARKSYYENEARFWTQKAEKADADEAHRKAAGYSDSLFSFLTKRC
jgi:hypothetical protein